MMPTWNEVAAGLAGSVVLWQIARRGIPWLIDYFTKRWQALEDNQTEMRKMLGTIESLLKAHLAENEQYRKGVEHRLTVLEGEVGIGR